MEHKTHQVVYDELEVVLKEEDVVQILAEVIGKRHGVTVKPEDVEVNIVAAERPYLDNVVVRAARRVGPLK